MEEFGVKELYDIVIKTTQPMVFCGREYEKGEPLLFLERAQVAMLNQNRTRVYARGGKENRRLILWETNQPIQLQIQQGVISYESLSLLTNNVIETTEKHRVPLTQRFQNQLPDGEKYIKLPLKKPINTNKEIYVYDNKGNKVPKQDTSLLAVDKQNEEDEQTYSEVWIDNQNEDGTYKGYQYKEGFIVNSYYTDEIKVLNIGENVLHGYLKLEAKTRAKDDTDGYEKTGIFVIPKMRIMSDLSIRLGDSITPMVYGFTVEGEPVGPYNETKVCEMYFLDEDLDAEDLV